jgi:hypothetical protein
MRVTDVVALIDRESQAVHETPLSWPPPASWLSGEYSLGC